MSNIHDSEISLYFVTLLQKNMIALITTTVYYSVQLLMLNLNILAIATNETLKNILKLFEHSQYFRENIS